MSQPTFQNFAHADPKSVFEFVQYFHDTKHPSDEFVQQLKDQFDQLGHEHQVAGLMIARDWFPNRFCRIAAEYLRNANTDIWTAAYRVLLSVSSLSNEDYNLIVESANLCPGDCVGLLQILKGRLGS